MQTSEIFILNMLYFKDENFISSTINNDFYTDLQKTGFYFKNL